LADGDQRHQPHLLSRDRGSDRVRRGRPVHRATRTTGTGGRRRMISVLVIAHEPLATALLHCTRHIYQRLPGQIAALDVLPDEDPDAALQAARDLASRINDGSGLVVLTDLFGATPARVAVQ